MQLWSKFNGKSCSALIPDTIKSTKQINKYITFEKLPYVSVQVWVSGCQQNRGKWETMWAKQACSTHGLEFQNSSVSKSCDFADDLLLGKDRSKQRTGP